MHACAEDIYTCLRMAIVTAFAARAVLSVIQPGRAPAGLHQRLTASAACEINSDTAASQICCSEWHVVLGHAKTPSAHSS